MIKIVIAEEREIVSQGLVNIISTIDDVEVLAIKTNSADLLEYAKNFGKQTELKMTLTKAYFSDRKNVSKRAILKQALLDVGLNAEDGLAKLDNEEACFEIKSKEKYWQNLGVSSVPTIVFNRQSAVTGAQPVDTFKQILGEIINKQ